MSRASALISAFTLVVAVGLPSAACTRKPAPEPSATPTVPASASDLPTQAPSASPSSSPSPPKANPTKSPTKPPTSPATAFPASLRGQDLTRIPTTRKIVALTFDAGANANGLTKILATLDAKNATGTFFLTGDFAKAYPSRAREISTAGYRLGNHTVDHPHLPQLTDAQIRAQVLNADAMIQEATGNSPRPWFRFPYGDRDAHTIALVNGYGYACIRWTVDTLGWKGTSGGQSASTVTQRVLAAATPGEIVLMHVGSNPDDHTTLDADALAAVIDGLRAKGYSFVTLDALL